MAVSVAVCEILSVKEWCDLENRVRVRSRSLEMAPFDRSHTSFYLSSMRYGAILYRLRDIATYWLKIPHMYLAPRRGWFRRNFVKMFDADKTRMIGLSYDEKKLWQYLSRFHPINVTDRRTDRRTDENRDFLYPLAFDAPVTREPRRNIAVMFGTKKTRVVGAVGLPDGNNKFGLYVQRCRQKTGVWWTDRQTDSHLATA